MTAQALLNAMIAWYADYCYGQKVPSLNSAATLLTQAAMLVRDCTEQEAEEWIGEHIEEIIASRA